MSPKKKDTKMRLGFPLGLREALSDSWMVLTRGFGKECDIQTPEPLRGLYVQPLTKQTRKHLGEFQDSGQSKMGYSKTTPPPPKKKIREKIREKKKEEQTNKTRHLFANQLSL